MELDMNNYIIKDIINYEDFCDIRKSIGWNELNPKQVERAINGSMFNVSVFDNDLCVGCGRIVGDGVLKGVLTDVMVRDNYQGKGVGKLIVTTLIKNLEESVKEGESFQLEASPTFSNREFYTKCGMKYKPENQDGTYLWIRK
jgi:GNAT superfamily N-acetyltransferase